MNFLLLNVASNWIFTISLYPLCVPVHAEVDSLNAKVSISHNKNICIVRLFLV
ncbi:hypothetical protein E1A91_A03G050900v1 [Gossypium mustelinum]|uniref:Uncharacterized protein n=1 Tax=Gossypium mustelinum TaxID=34275 RepID=A0A5D2ZVB6_GOSMU|nr:hypothetical protein E1A91_A03G050900v1 [Gossypium mustelinum]